MVGEEKYNKKKVVNRVGLASVLQPNYETTIQAYFKFAFALKKIIQYFNLNNNILSELIRLILK